MFDKKRLLTVEAIRQSSSRLADVGTLLSDRFAPRAVIH
jgi:hypothetical protein